MWALQMVWLAVFLSFFPSFCSRSCVQASFVIISCIVCWRGCLLFFLSFSFLFFFFFFFRTGTTGAVLRFALDLVLFGIVVMTLYN